MGWREGSYNFRTKFSKSQIDEVSSMLENCNKFKPIEIHRAIRGLKFLKYWKGSEYRTFLFYLGPVVLKGILSDEVYEHFLLLSSAVTILSCKEYLKYIIVAEKMIELYIEKFIHIYGIDSISSNVHNLCHVVDDVKNFGILPDISTYPFENFLNRLKHLVRSGNVVLSQISKRIAELSQISTASETYFKVHVEKKVLTEEHELPECEGVFHQVKLGKKFVLKADGKNNFFMTKNKNIVSMINATYLNDKIHIFGSRIKTYRDFFTKPFASSQINIFSIKNKITYENPKLYSLTEIKCKLFYVENLHETVFFPIIHTLDEHINL